MPQKKPGARIFISYRRDDTDAEAENIYHHLKNAFGDIVFKDNMRIGPGDRWKEVILSDLEASKVVLAIVGKKWFIQDIHGCVRLEDEDDWVRKELEYAISNQKRLVPVLINGARCPSQKSFPHIPILKEGFPSSQAISVNTRELDKELHKLIYTDLPSWGIEPLSKEDATKQQVDVLADYPLPQQVQLGTENLPPPYVGIRPFKQNESLLFFGRDQDILKLIKKIESSSTDKRIILYHGRSGVGKSSLLTAGLYLRMKNKGWEIPKPRRRNKEKGLAADLLDLMEVSDDALPRLFVLDQVEEIFSNPQPDVEKEIAEFQASLLHFLEKGESDRLLLSFRSDYFTQVRKILDDKGMSYDELELFPLDRHGVLEAINSVVQKPELQQLYKLSYRPGTLPEDICNDVLQDKNSSHITTLLQYQLEKLFFRAAPDWKALKPKPAVVIRDTDYTEDFRKNNLDCLLDAEFELLCGNWQDAHESGLTLDVLHQYITEQVTAGSRLDAEILKAYSHVPRFPEFFDFLKNRLTLLIGLPQENGTQPSARLSHDSLAPLLLARFRNSTAAGQRAWQLLEPKLRDLRNAISPTLLSGEDLIIVEEGRSGMRALPELDVLIEESRMKHAQQEAERLQNNETIFQNFAKKGGADLIYSLDHEQALENIEVAIKMEYPDKKAMLYPLLEELLFFFAEGGRRPELARRAASMLQQLQPQSDVEVLLRCCLDEAWTSRIQFAPLLQALPSFPTLQARYYPEMVDIPGGEFDMGSDEKEEGHQSDEILHKVKLSSFRIAATPLTFYQYALYSEATKKNIKSRTPPWGRCGDHPVVYINWYDAIEYCNWLSEWCGYDHPHYHLIREKNSDQNNEVEKDYLKWKVIPDMSNLGFRLPTEAEWEYAARGGNNNSRSIYAGGNDLNNLGWHWQNSGDEPLNGEWIYNSILNNSGRTHPVGEKKDNGKGLYDLSGNVYEWCWDWYGEKYFEVCKMKGVVLNPSGPGKSDVGRVLRGGAWNEKTKNCRTAFRNWIDSYNMNFNRGFRPAQSIIPL